MSEPTAADVLDALADMVAARVAARLVELANPRAAETDGWLDTARAADYAGLHRDTLRKLAAQGRVRYEQEAPGCKLYFRRSDVDRLKAGCLPPLARNRRGE